MHLKGINMRGVIGSSMGPCLPCIVGKFFDWRGKFSLLKLPDKRS